MKLRSAFITAILANGTLAQAGDGSTDEGALPEFLQQFDTNEDGIIDEEERQAIRDLRANLREERRSSIDSDGDGKISRDEVETARESMREKIEGRRLEKFNEIAGEDGVISKDEYATIPGVDGLPDFVFDAIFDRLDADNSGDVSSEEFFHRLRPHDQKDQSKHRKSGFDGKRPNRP